MLFVPESPVRTPGRISWLRRRAAVRLAGRAADRAERGAGLGLGFRHACSGCSSPRRGARPSPGCCAELRAGPPLIDMQMMRLPGGVDHQPGRAARRRRACTRRSRSCPSSCRRRGGRLRVRREHHRVRADPAAVGDHDVRRRACSPGRLPAGSAAKAVVVAGCLIGGARDGDHRLRARAHVGDLPRQRAAWASGFGLAFSAMSALIVAAVPPSRPASPAA